MATDERGLQGTGYVRKEVGWMTNDENGTNLGRCLLESDTQRTMAQAHPLDRRNRKTAAVYPLATP